MAYIGRQQDGFGVRSRFIYTATGGQTTFNTDDSSNALSYSDGAYVDVYLNGVFLTLLITLQQVSRALS
jgi:hypothetical protein